MDRSQIEYFEFGLSFELLLRSRIMYNEARVKKRLLSPINIAKWSQAVTQRARTPANRPNPTKIEGFPKHYPGKPPETTPRQ